MYQNYQCTNNVCPSGWTEATCSNNYYYMCEILLANMPCWVGAAAARLRRRPAARGPAPCRTPTLQRRWRWRLPGRELAPPAAPALNVCGRRVLLSKVPAPTTATAEPAAAAAPAPEPAPAAHAAHM
jgi:hypothetical protein